MFTAGRDSGSQLTEDILTVGNDGMKAKIAIRRNFFCGAPYGYFFQYFFFIGMRFNFLRFVNNELV